MLKLNLHITEPDHTISGTTVYLHPLISNPALPVPNCPTPDMDEPHLESWIPLTSLEDMENSEYDVLIGGTGMGGGATLWRLSDQWGQNSMRIGILEAGDLVLPTHGQNLATLNEAR